MPLPPIVSPADWQAAHEELLVKDHFMFAPGEQDVCSGCSSFTDDVAGLAHRNARDTAFALVSAALPAELEAYRRRMGWTLPWSSSYGSDLSRDLGLVCPDGGERLQLNVYLRDGDSPEGWPQSRPYVWWRRHDEYEGATA
jgi:predicted dithiol-disulfide oxidoreductase (DUF899 family)